MTSSAIQHLLDVFSHLNQGWGNMSEVLFEWLAVSQLDDVLSGISASHFILVQEEDTMVLHEKPLGSLCILL